MYHETVKTRQVQYKLFKEQMLATTPKSEQKTTIKKLKDEQTRKLAIIAQQYERSIREMMEQQNVCSKKKIQSIFTCVTSNVVAQVKLDSEQVKEADELRQRLSQELELLMAYQSKIKMHAEQQHARERKQLDDRVSLRRALLEQKVSDHSSKQACSSRVFIRFVFVVAQMEEESARFVQERDELQSDMRERQRRELEEFDLESSTMGLDALDIRAESERTYMYEDVDTMSSRGSMLSLTPSSSTNSFLQMQQQQQLTSQSSPSLHGAVGGSRASSAAASRNNSVDQSRQQQHQNSQLLYQQQQQHAQQQLQRQHPHRNSKTTTQL